MKLPLRLFFLATAAIFAVSIAGAADSGVEIGAGYSSVFTSQNFIGDQPGFQIWAVKHLSPELYAHAEYTRIGVASDYIGVYPIGRIGAAGIRTGHPRADPRRFGFDARYRPVASAQNNVLSGSRNRCRNGIVVDESFDARRDHRCRQFVECDPSPRSGDGRGECTSAAEVAGRSAGQLHVPAYSRVVGIHHRCFRAVRRVI